MLKGRKRIRMNACVMLDGKGKKKKRNNEDEEKVRLVEMQERV